MRGANCLQELSAFEFSPSCGAVDCLLPGRVVYRIDCSGSEAHGVCSALVSFTDILVFGRSFSTLSGTSVIKNKMFS